MKIDELPTTLEEIILLEILTIPNFISWAQSKDPPNQIVGIPCKGGHCPIARFLTEKIRDVKNTDINVFVVHTRAYISDGTTEYLISLPEWAKKFIRTVDRESKRTLTACDVLNVMHRNTHFSSNYS